MRGEPGHLLPGRHRGLPAGKPGQDHRLGHLRDGQLAPDGRGGRGETADPGDDVGGQPQFGADLQLFLQRPPQRRVTGVDAGHREPAARGPPVDLVYAFQRQPGRVDDLGVAVGMGEHVRVHQRGRPDDHVRLADHPDGAQGEQVRGPGAGSDERDPPGWAGGHTGHCRRRVEITVDR